MKNILFITGALLILFGGTKHTNQAHASDSCPTSRITIKSFHVKWVDECRTRSCAYMKGAGEMVNTCSMPVGVQIKMTGYDKTGAPITSHTGWPSSIKNIQPGKYVFSLDHWLDYDRAIKRFEVTVESTKVWN